MGWFIAQVSLYLSFYVTTRFTVWAQCQTCQLNHHRLPDFDGKSVSDFPLTSQGGLGKLWMCTRMCSEDSRCRSYRYNSMTGVCSTYGVGYSTLENTFNTVTEETGSQLYLMCGKTQAFGTTCKSTTECGPTFSSCRNGSCECSIGYSYDVNTGDCVTNCTLYGNFFAKILDIGIHGCNRDEVTSSTAAECMEACRKETSFSCINSEFEFATGVCNLCDQAWFDLSSEYWELNATGWIMFYRHCGW